jgi:formylglycine-generating enzyme required for sulfatase activity
MNLSKIAIFGVTLTLLIWSCKTQPEERHYAKYHPVFDQTKRVYVETPNRSTAQLDTMVTIRSNLGEKVDTIRQQFIFDETFEITRGELAVPVELINEKPPKFDTFLVASRYLLHKDLVDILYPKHEINGQADSLLAQEGPALASQTQLPPQKIYYTLDDIKNDSLRETVNADSIFSENIKSAPWQISDSIPFVEGIENYFLDSLLKLEFDTVKVKRYVPEDIVPQLPFKSLVKETKQTFVQTDTIEVKVPVSFIIFYPDEDDVIVPMVRVQGGTFKMGSDEFDEDERPATRLTVSNFLIGKYEVTNKLFCYFLNDYECDSLGEIDGLPIIKLYNDDTKIYYSKIKKKYFAKSGFEDFPVVNVTWYGAQMYSKQAGGRLPSEAEWEYAARGGVFAHRYYIDSKKDDFAYLYYYSGADLMGRVGVFVDNSNGYCHKGGEFRPNELGIFDMSGNVWEWCYDKYTTDFLRRNGTSRDPMNLTGSEIRVNKGGSWSSDAMYCRVTNRNFAHSSECFPYLGFRFWRKW